MRRNATVLAKSTPGAIGNNERRSGEFCRGMDVVHRSARTVYGYRQALLDQATNSKLRSSNFTTAATATFLSEKEIHRLHPQGVLFSERMPWSIQSAHHQATFHISLCLHEGCIVTHMCYMSSFDFFNK